MEIVIRALWQYFFYLSYVDLHGALFKKLARNQTSHHFETATAVSASKRAQAIAYGRGTHCFSGYDGIEPVKCPVCAWELLVKVGVDGVLQYTKRVVWPLMQVDAYLVEDGVWNVVEGVVCQHICRGRLYVVRRSFKQSNHCLV